MDADPHVVQCIRVVHTTNKKVPISEISLDIDLSIFSDLPPLKLVQL